MMQPRTKAQTATEYLVIVAVVIIIALIVVTVLGGIPGIGGGASQAVDSAVLASRPIGISGITVGSIGATMTIVNNRNSAVEILSVTFEDSQADFAKDLPLRLPAGSSRQIESFSDVGFSGTVNDAIVITYRDESTEAEFTTSANDYRFSVSAAQNNVLRKGHGLVFVTSSDVNPNLGGASGADDVCVQHAQSAGLYGGTNSKVWKAYVAEDSSTSGYDRLVQSPLPIRLINGTTVVDRTADLLVEDGGNYLLHSISVTEQNEVSGGGSVWTGTEPDGSVAANTCTFWTSDGGEGMTGALFGTDSTWTFVTNHGCGSAANRKLYCFEQY